LCVKSCQAYGRKKDSRHGNPGWKAWRSMHWHLKQGNAMRLHGTGAGKHSRRLEKETGAYNGTDWQQTVLFLCKNAAADRAWLVSGERGSL